MLSQPQAKGAFDSFTPTDIVIPQGEDPGHICQQEEKLENYFQKEATVLGFAVTGFLSIISGKKSAMPFATGSLIASAVSSAVAGASLFLLTDNLVSLRTSFQLCASEKEHPTSSPYWEYGYSTSEVKDCALDGVSLIGVLVVMLLFTVQELFLAAYASLFWWKWVYPKNPAAVQILLALIIAVIGTVFAFNYFSFSQRFPLIFFTGYPFWGAFIFIVTGYLTGHHRKETCLGHCVTAMNVISVLAAVAGIVLTIVSFQQQHRYCEAPSLEGICVIGRILFTGILSVVLIISIAELSISVTIASFRSKCWTKSNEIVFFLPLDVTHENEPSIPEENAVIQFDVQESSRDNSPTNVQPVFFGGYTFFKLRVSKNPLTFHHAGKRGSNNHYISSLSGPDEQQKNIPPPLKCDEKETKLKFLPPILEKGPLEDITHLEQINDEDLLFTLEQSREMQTEPPQVETSPLRVIPPHSVKLLEALPPSDLSSQALPVQASWSEPPAFHVTQSYNLISDDTKSQDIPSPDMPYQDMLGRSSAQVLPTQAMQFETQMLHAMHALSVQHLEQQSLDLQLQNSQHQDQQFKHISYQDIQSEVKLLTQDWKHEEEHHSRKSIKQHSFEEHHKDRQSSRNQSLELSTQGQQPPRKKSLQQHIKGWLSPKKHSVDKDAQVRQFSDQQAELQPTQGKQSLEQQSPNGQGKDQQGREEKSPKKEIQHQQAKALQAQEEQSARQLSQPLQSQIQKFQDWPSLDQRSQDWGTQEWRNRDHKTQFEMKPSLNWESQAWQTEDLLEKEFLNKKVLYKEVRPVLAMPPLHLDERLQEVQLPYRQYQEKKQQDLLSTGAPKEDRQIAIIQTKDIKLADMNSLCQHPSDFRSEDMKPDFHHSSCQSSIQDASSTYLSNVGSEQDVQQATSISSTSYKEDSAFASCYPKDQQQSEDSD